MNIVLEFVFVMIATALLDVCWAKYTFHLTNRHAVGAALWSALIMCFGGSIIIEYSKNHWLLAAAVVGSFIGTYLVVKYSKHKRG